MTVHNYDLVQKEQVASQNDLQKELLHHAQVLEYFFSERVNDLQILLAGQELAAYFEGKALGMSMAYGLKASLTGIARSFAELIQSRRINKSAIYSRVVFLNAQGRVLVDTKASNKQKSGTAWTAFLDPEGNQNRLRLIKDQGQPAVVISLPYFFRQKYSGQLIAWLCPCSAYRLLGIRKDDPQPADYLAVQDWVLPLGPDSQSPQLPRPLLNRERIPTATLKRFSSSGNFTPGRKMVAGMMSIPGTPLDLISIQGATEIFGSQIDRFMPFLLGVLGLVLLSGTGVIFWGNTRRLLLQTRLDTEAKSRAQIEGMNQ
ncbi:MAG: hypothetical protein K9J81_12645, partial [Desulfohalobiaceae bacterium]|nr:hypothetical protein [Desulfohalobiaceae bacterium]